MGNGRLLISKPSGGVTTVASVDGVSNTSLILPESGTVATTGDVTSSITNATSGLPAFYATKAGQSFTASVWTKLACNTEVYDKTNAYDSVTNFRFTPQKSGKYNVSVQILTTNTQTGGGVAIYKNGALLIVLQQINGTAIGLVFSGNVTVELNGTTDYIEAYGVWNSNNTGNATFQANYIVGV